MRVLVVSQVFPPKPGGSGRWLWELYRRMTSIEVHVAAGDCPGAAEFDARAELSITRVALNLRSWGLLSARGAVDHARAFLAIHRIVRQRGVEEIHCGKCLPEGTIALALRRLTGVPYVCYTHGEELTLAATSRELKFLTRRVLAGARRIVANSQNTKRILIDTYDVPATTIVVMHPGVDTTLFVPASLDAAARARLGWAGRRVVLTVGALQKRKGQDMMIRALVEVKRQCPDVLYAIAGEGWERPYLEGLVADLDLKDTVQFCGVPGEGELVNYYQQCDLFVLANRQVGWDIEGFGIVSLEAQACGKPVIVGRSGGAPETVDTGVTGEIVDCEDPTVLAATVIDLLEHSDRRQRLGDAGRRRTVERFMWDYLARDADRQLMIQPERR